MSQSYAANVFKLNSKISERQEDSLNEEVENISRVLPTIARGLRWNVDDPAGASPAQELPNVCNFGQDFIASETNCKIDFHVSPAFTSYLQLSIYLDDDTAPKGVKQTCMRLTHDTCRKLELVEINVETHSELTWGAGSSAPRCCCFVLLIEYDTNHFLSENLFPESPSPALRLLQKDLNSTGQLAAVFKLESLGSFKTHLRSLIQAFGTGKDSRPLADPIRFLDGRARAQDLPSITGPTVAAEPPRASFFSFNDYVATLGVGTKLVQEAREKADSEPFECAIHIISADLEGTKRYYAVFKLPRETKIVFSSGDKAVVQVDSQAVSHKHWTMHVIEPLPWSGAGVVTVWLEPRGDVTSSLVMPVIPIPDGYKGHGLKSLLMRTGLKAKITPEDRHSEFPYIMEAFNRLRADSRSAATGSMTAAVCRFLTGNKIQNIPKWDIYEPLANKELAAEETMNLDGSQKGGIRQARSAPAGIVICHGGPGSGKTHFVVEAVMPFFLDTGKEHHVLLTAQGNRAADALALGVQARIQPLIESGQLPGDRYVLRLQSIKTEKSIFFRFAAKSRREKVLARAAEAQKSMTTIGIQHQGQTSSDSAVSHCRAFASSKYEFVDDKRVQHIELTLGQRMLQIAGLEPSIPKLPNMPDFSELSQLYQRFAEGKELSSEQMIRLEGEVEELMAFTIARATGVCATIAGAADSFFTRNYSKAELIVVDEASRVPEFHWWPLLAFYPNVVGKIMVGDYFQLPPRVDEGLEMRNICLPQLEMSLQERAQRMGIQAVFFRAQYRAMPEIAEVYSKVCYQSRLVSDPSTHLDERPLARELVLHNAAKYKTHKPIVFFDIPDAEQEKDGSTNFCVKYGNMVLRILQDLLTAGFGSTKPCTIAILTPYKSELNKLWVAKKEMSETRATAAAKDVNLETADKVQGMEYDIVIVDPVVVHSAGFLTMQRLNVLFSRAKYGLYVVGNLGGWNKMDQERAEWIQAFGEALSKHKVTLPAAEMRGSVTISDD